MTAFVKNISGWLALCIFCGVGVGACKKQANAETVKLAEAAANAPETAPRDTQLLDKPQNDPSQKLMLAEYAYQNERFREAADHYFDVAKDSDDPVVLERSIELSLRANDVDQALQTVNHWQQLNPDSSELMQYRLLLHIKKENYHEAALALHDFSGKVKQKMFKGLDISMALLERETTAERIYETLKAYTTLSEFDPYGYYYEAMFGMRLEAFEDVLSVVKRSEGALEEEETQQKLALFHVKALTRLGRETEALAVLNKLVVTAADVATKQNYARILSSLGQSEKAMVLLTEIYKEEPENVPVLMDMIGLQLDGKKFEEALVLIEELEKKKGQKSNAFFFRGLVYETQDKFEQALEQYRKISRDLKNTARVRMRIVNSLEKSQGLNAAISFLKEERKLLESKQDKIELILLESDLYRDKKRYEESLLALQEAAKLEPGNLNIAYSEALLYEKMKNIEASEEKLRFIIDKDERHSSALNALGYMLAVHTTRLDEAHSYLQKAIKLSPNDPAIIDSLGWVHYRKGDLEKAEEYIRKAFDKIQDPEVASHLIEILAKTGRREEASKILEDMLKEHPDDELLLKVKDLVRG